MRGYPGGQHICQPYGIGDLPRAGARPRRVPPPCRDRTGGGMIVRSGMGTITTYLRSPSFLFFTVGAGAHEGSGVPRSSTLPGTGEAAVAALWWNRQMLETPDEMNRLQQLLDKSAAGAGPHLRGIITDDRRLSAQQVCQRLQGMCLLALATVTADGRPLVGPVDGYLLHGSFYFSSGRHSVRMRHLTARPAVSATHLAGEGLAVTVHGRAELFDVSDPAHGELRQAMLDHYRPRQGPAFEAWLDREDPIGARIAAQKMFTFSMDA
jgi:uncharacterized pyridoxamine 5'-phosphate oxidase family protein